MAAKSQFRLEELSADIFKESQKVGLTEEDHINIKYSPVFLAASGQFY